MVTVVLLLFVDNFFGSGLPVFRSIDIPSKSSVSNALTGGVAVVCSNYEDSGASMSRFLEPENLERGSHHC